MTCKKKEMIFDEDKKNDLEMQRRSELESQLQRGQLDALFHEENVEHMWRGSVSEPHLQSNLLTHCLGQEKEQSRKGNQKT